MSVRDSVCRRTTLRVTYVFRALQEKGLHREVAVVEATRAIGVSLVNVWRESFNRSFNVFVKELTDHPAESAPLLESNGKDSRLGGIRLRNSLVWSSPVTQN